MVHDMALSLLDTREESIFYIKELSKWMNSKAPFRVADNVAFLRIMWPNEDVVSIHLTVQGVTSKYRCSVDNILGSQTPIQLITRVIANDKSG